MLREGTRRGKKVQEEGPRRDGERKDSLQLLFLLITIELPWAYRFSNLAVKIAASHMQSYVMLGETNHIACYHGNHLAYRRPRIGSLFWITDAGEISANQDIFAPLPSHFHFDSGYKKPFLPKLARMFLPKFSI